MMAVPALALLIPVAGGSLLIFVGWPRERASTADLLLMVALGVGLGLGLSSVGFFIGLVGFGSSPVYFVIEAVGLAVLLALLFRRLRGGDFGFGRQSSGHPVEASFAFRLLLPGFVASLITALCTFGYRAATYTHGGWDAATIWNLRARFLFRGAGHWRDAFSDLLGTWTHADYPLLVPGAAARAWSFIGSEPQLVPMLLGLLFVLATVFLLVGALASARSPGQGLLAGIVLLCCNTLIYQGTYQYADVPLGFFVLATFVALALADTVERRSGGFVALAGLTAGLAAWTKNEGLLFVLALFFSHLLVIAHLRGWRQALRRQGAMLLGLAPMLIVVAGFKWGIAPPNDLVASLRPADIVDRLTDPGRLWYVVQSFGGRFLTLSGWLVPAPLALVLYLFVVGRGPSGVERESLGTMAITLGVLLAGYLFVYVVTPYDLTWHVETSMHRLLLHLWPGLLFAYFLLVKNPEAAVAEVTSTQPAGAAES
jgi:hypothetical protein